MLTPGGPLSPGPSLQGHSAFLPVSRTPSLETGISYFPLVTLLLQNVCEKQLKEGRVHCGSVQGWGIPVGKIVEIAAPLHLFFVSSPGYETEPPHLGRDYHIN